MVTHGEVGGGAKRKHHGGASKMILILSLDMNADHIGGDGKDIHLNEAQKNLHLFFSVIRLCLGKKRYFKRYILQEPTMH